MAFNYSPKIVTDGLVLYLDAANNRSYPGSGTTWTDLSRGGNNGVLTNGPIFNSGNGGSIVFDGVDDYINCGTNSSTLLSSMTISSTFSFISYSSGTYLIVSRLGGTPSFRHNYFFGIADFGTGAKFYFGFKQSGSNTYPLVQINMSPVLNTIYNFTATYSTSTSVALYLNGQSQSITGPNTGTNPLITNQIVDLDPTTNCSIGSGAPSQNLYYSNARIYNAQIYNRALSATEVLQNYNATKTRFGLI
jgi:hypothetical protein